MKEMQSAQVGIWTMLTCIVALALLVNLVMVIFGNAVFAWWHYPTLLICTLFSREEMLVLISEREGKESKKRA